MQNKPNLLHTQTNVNKVLTKDYENVHLAYTPKTNPIYRRAASRLRESAIAASPEALRRRRLAKLAQTQRLLIYRVEPKFFNLPCKNSLTRSLNSIEYGLFAASGSIL